MGPSRRMTEDIETHAARLEFPFFRRDIKDRLELVNFLSEINLRAKEDGLRPILVFDAHGNHEDGLVMRDGLETMPWTELGALLRQINVSTLNNLCVIGAACFSLRAIAPAKLNEPAPFFVLLAPEQEVNVGFLECNLPRFFEQLFMYGDLDDSYNLHLSASFKYFHCEKMLFIVIAKYIKKACKGKSAAIRREQLMTEVFMQGMKNSKANRKAIRAKLKIGLKPDQALLDRYAQTFLVGKRCSFTMEELLAHIGTA